MPTIAPSKLRWVKHPGYRFYRFGVIGKESGVFYQVSLEYGPAYNFINSYRADDIKEELEVVKIKK